MPPGRFSFRDLMDDDGFGHRGYPDRGDGGSGRGRAAGGLHRHGRRRWPAGSTPCAAVTLSAVFYVVRCLLDDDQAPTNAGIFRPVRVILPEGTLVNARFPRAVAAGNVETSQRIVDVLLGAFGQALPDLVAGRLAGHDEQPDHRRATARARAAASPTTRPSAGGMGAAPGADGLSGVHVHMTNTLNTPAEALEYAYPLRVTRYELRRGSGGAGRWRGGDGLYPRDRTAGRRAGDDPLGAPAPCAVGAGRGRAGRSGARIGMSGVRGQADWSKGAGEHVSRRDYLAR